MSQNPKPKYTKVELLELATKYLGVNKQVAKLAPNKIMTRRVIKQNILEIIEVYNAKENKTQIIFENPKYNKILDVKSFINEFAPYKVDDIFWLREPAKVESCNVSHHRHITYSYLSDNHLSAIEIPDRYWMNEPKWMTQEQGVPNGCIKEMARFFYRVTSVRVERLQDISDKDIVKEGIYKKNNEYTDPISKIALPTPKSAFSMLWNSTAKAPYRWEDKSVYVWVIEYERLEYVK